MKSDDQREYEQLMRGHRSLRRKDAVVSDEEKIVTNEMVVAGLNAEIDRLQSELADRDKAINRLTKAKAPKSTAATIKVSLPELAPGSWNEERACGWNMCLYAVRRLNGIES